MSVQEIGRLAFREEGRHWNCYWCPNQTDMDNKVLIGCIDMKSIRFSDELKDHFMVVMRETFEVATKNAIGVTPQWTEPRAAPEVERSGHA